MTIALVAISAACESSTAPQTDVAPSEATVADYDALGRLLGSDGFAAVNGLGGRTPLSTGTVIAAVQQLPGLVRDNSGRDYVLGLFRAAAAESPKQGAALRIISSVHLGKTLVYDTALDQYVIDPARTGAPSNGVRFIAYEQDSAGTPIATREIGYADLLDEGTTTGNAIALRLKVVLRDVTTLDYRSTVDLRPTEGSIDVTGFATDGVARLNFTIGLDARRVGTRTLLDADFELGVPVRDFTVVGTVRNVEEDEEGNGEITVTARHQQNTLRSAVTGTAGVLNGSISWNGATFVTISGPADQPTLLGRTGQPLTIGEMLVVQRVMRLNDDVFDLVEELVEPVEDLVLLGWFL
ncbi:MAG: hypothetical protein ACKVS7_12660 [Gemmatimonadaceae bacterium]